MTILPAETLRSLRLDGEAKRHAARLVQIEDQFRRDKARVRRPIRPPRDIPNYISRWVGGESMTAIVWSLGYRDSSTITNEVRSFIYGMITDCECKKLLYRLADFKPYALRALERSAVGICPYELSQVNYVLDKHQYTNLVAAVVASPTIEAAKELSSFLAVDGRRQLEAMVAADV
jgi:hypothetical protein